MARLGLATSGKSLGRTKGFPYLRPADLRYTVRRAALTGLSVGTLVLSVVAAYMALFGYTDPGIDFDGTDRVAGVTTTGYAWSAGIRPGQAIDFIADVRDPSEWSITTHDEAGSHTAYARPFDTQLRNNAPLGVAAVALAWLSVVFLRTRRRWVLPTAALALLTAAAPLRIEGSPNLSTIGLALAACIPASAWVIRLRQWPWAAISASIALCLAVVVWASARLTASELAPTAETGRETIAFWATLGLIVDRMVLPSVVGQPWSIVRPRLFDVLVVATLAVLLLVGAVAANLPQPLIGLLLLALLAGMPVVRHRLAGPIEELLFGDVRQQAAAEASEAERARLARELHDVPLQELAAVIRRLEIVPGAEAESEDLRALASHLRDVATELRPPVLDDLGLPAALDFLAEGASTTRIPVTAVVTDDTGFGPERRPPTDVELAMYRIAAEAVANAIRHSGGSAVTINAHVAPDRVDLAITDDGAGLKSEAARDAARRKRLGLLSMRRRAEAIDAELSIDTSAGGTKVTVTWRA